MTCARWRRRPSTAPRRPGSPSCSPRRARPGDHGTRDAVRVLAGCGLVAGEDDARARATFDLLARVSPPWRLRRGHPVPRRRLDRLRAPDRHHRVSIDPTSTSPSGLGGQPAPRGLGAPGTCQRQHRPLVPDDRHGRPRLVTDARALLEELADRLGVDGSGSDRHQPRCGGRDRRRRPVPDPTRPRRRGGRAGPAGSPPPSPWPGRRSVVLLERGRSWRQERLRRVVYARVLDQLVPLVEEVPVERWVVRRSTMLMTARSHCRSTTAPRRGRGPTTG